VADGSRITGWFALMAAAAAAGCGGSSEAQSAADPERLCRDYRLAVANVRFPADGADSADDFRAAARTARAAAEGTEPGDLSAYGHEYVERLDSIAAAYDDAAAALEAGDQQSFLRALDVAEPTDDEIDGAARRGGLERCALAAAPESLSTGTVPVERAAEVFEREFRVPSLEAAGNSGNHLVPMRAYRYRVGNEQGTAHVFSGQGRVWALICLSKRSGGPSDELEHACERAVDTIGFLMF
jgi:hypothetical protein